MLTHSILFLTSDDSENYVHFQSDFFSLLILLDILSITLPLLKVVNKIKFENTNVIE